MDDNLQTIHVKNK
jgi:hypothetical protein